MKLITNLDSKRYEAWNSTHPYGQILQSEEWGKFKSRGAWTYELVGMEDDGKLVAACMLLKRKLPGVPFYMFYASRGYVLDYTSKSVIKAFTEAMYTFAKKNRGIMVKIDPCVKFVERDSEGDLVEGGLNNQELIDYLKGLGYAHKGTTLDFEGVQPRFVYKLPLDRTLDALMKKFHHKTRYNIRLAEKKGVEIFEGTRDDLAEFERIMKVTGQRDGFITRPLSYFQDMYDELYPQGKLKLYLARYNVQKAYDIASKALNDELAKEKQDDRRIEKLKGECEELLGLKKEYPNGIIVSGTIMLINGSTAWYLYGASDNVYRNIMPNYLIQWKMISDAYQLGCTMYDFRGISGDRSPDHHLYGLYRFKKGFTGEFVEYIGEFDLIVRPFMYQVFEWGLPKFKQVVRRLKG